MGGKPRAKKDDRVALHDRTDPNDKCCLGCGVCIATVPTEDPRFCSIKCGYDFALGDGVVDDGGLAYDHSYCVFCDTWYANSVWDSCPHHLPEDEARLAATRPGKLVKSNTD